jgi:hypothetical protein
MKLIVSLESAFFVQVLGVFCRHRLVLGHLGVMFTSLLDLYRCHTCFSKENKCKPICIPGSNFMYKVDIRVRLVRVSGPTKPTGCRRSAFDCLHHPLSQALQMKFSTSCLHPQKRQKRSFLQSQARLTLLFLLLMIY